MIKEYINSQGKKFTGYLITNPKTPKALPYILVVPNDMENDKQIVMESLNLERTNIVTDIAEHVIRELKAKIEIVDDAPYLIPFIPDVRGGRPYYQQLSRECFETAINGEYKIDYDRIDIQVVNTLEDAKNIIEQEHGKNVNEKIFLNGYSSSGVFAQRFAMLHPNLVARALIGGAAGTIPIPTDEFEYPIGIKDYRELFNKEFDEEEYKNIQFAYYVAEYEADKPAYEYDINGNKVERDNNGNLISSKQVLPPMHDMSYHLRSMPLELGRKQRNKLGKDIATRFKNSLVYYEDNGYNITSKIYKGSKHGNIYVSENPSRQSVLRDIIAIYRKNLRFKKDEFSANEISMVEQRKREGKIDIVI